MNQITANTLMQNVEANGNKHSETPSTSLTTYKKYDKPRRWMKHVQK